MPRRGFEAVSAVLADYSGLPLPVCVLPWLASAVNTLHMDVGSKCQWLLMSCEVNIRQALMEARCSHVNAIGLGTILRLESPADLRVPTISRFPVL